MESEVKEIKKSSIKEFRHKDVWNGVYLGVSFEIVKWQTESHPAWNYYLYLPMEQIPEELQKDFNLKPRYTRFTPMSRERTHYEYYNAIFSDLDWHGGITYYEKLGKVDREPLVIKIGCDYLHSYDYEQRGYQYDLDEVLSETLHTIDKLRERIPSLKYWCFWSGNYYSKDDGRLQDNGFFISYEGEKLRNKRAVQVYLSRL